MRELLIQIFSSPIVENGMEWLSVWHWLYLAVIAAATIALTAILLKRADAQVTEKTLRILAYAVPTLYIADFFIMPLSSSDHAISVMKLPFHICTLLAFFVPFAQFNRHFQKLRGVIAQLTFVCATAYLIYPGTALENYEPHSYLVAQTMLYHGAMFAWATASIASGAATIRFADLWKSAVAVILAQLWATFGNTVYSYGALQFDWFMMTGQSFPMLPTWVVPIGVFGVVFGGCVVVCAVTNLIKKK